MLTAILPSMRCPHCACERLRAEVDSVSCSNCAQEYPIRNGILDMLEEGSAEVITPFQHVMQSPLVVSIYENAWRRLGYFIASSRSFEREIDTIMAYRRKQKPALILDLACGPGVFTRRLAEHSNSLVIGFDLSWPMLLRARRSIIRQGFPNVILIRGTVFRLPFVDSAFPYINCCGALHLFDRPGEALDQIARIAGPGGHLSVQTTIRPTHSGGMAYLLEKFIRFGFFNEQELLQEIGAHGFQILESERHRISYSFLAQRSL